MPCATLPRTALPRTARVATLLLAVLAVVVPTAGVVAPASASPRDAARTAAYRTLTNGCPVSRRGIPRCGALMGGAYGANDDPARWERSLGRRLGVHRLYYQPGQVRGAVRDVRADLAHGRLPWVSFKVPHSWDAMARGRGDAWARSLARSLRDVGGPVWLAFVHEPEDDGDILAWRRMQERLGPIVRRTAPNIGFSAILMGYHELFGSPAYRLGRIWPRTKVDVAGFDVYNQYGRGGSRKHTPMGRYFRRIGAWAEKEGVAWGLAETGISHDALRDRPRWFRATYRKLVRHGGKALSYFNTDLHSFQDWRLTTTLKRTRYAAVLGRAPRLRG